MNKIKVYLIAVSKKWCVLLFLFFLGAIFSNNTYAEILENIKCPVCGKFSVNLTNEIGDCICQSCEATIFINIDSKKVYYISDDKMRTVNLLDLIIDMDKDIDDNGVADNNVGTDVDATGSNGVSLSDNNVLENKKTSNKANSNSSFDNTSEDSTDTSDDNPDNGIYDSEPESDDIAYMRQVIDEKKFLQNIVSPLSNNNFTRAPIERIDVVISDIRYDLDENGAILLIDNKTNKRYCDVIVTTRDLNNKKIKSCYFDNNGCMQLSWQNIDGNWYYFSMELNDKIGDMAIGIKSIDGVFYIFDNNGKLMN